jgi:hypothetical protein
LQPQRRSAGGLVQDLVQRATDADQKFLVFRQRVAELLAGHHIHGQF